ncbi:hypothetical protein J6590_099262 [Homalodisca vitripennis]|nr:hypothetical protein J6590_099262 [Homalodisca vitripennis]
MPAEIKTTKLERGEAIRRSGQGLLVLKWMDKKKVLVISSRHEDIHFQETEKYTRETPEQPRRAIMKPHAIMDYNNGMLAVDRHDQMVPSLSRGDRASPTMHPSCSGSLIS